MAKNNISFPIQGQSEQVLNEFDEYSKKRISLHKIAIHKPGTNEVIRHDFHMVIIDLNMTINLTLSESTIINLVNAMKS